MRGVRVLAVLPLALLAACAAPGWPPLEDRAEPMPPDAAQPAPERPYFTEIGVASWYGPRHQGRRTASGERFDMKAMTAAHPTLPFQTVLRVTDLATGVTVRVRVNDRGPFIRGRILDLSSESARTLGMRDQGLARVRIEAFASDQILSDMQAAQAPAAAPPKAP